MKLRHFSALFLLVGCTADIAGEPPPFEFEGATVAVTLDPNGLTAVLHETGALAPSATMTWDATSHESRIVFGELVDTDHLDGLEPETAARFLWSAWSHVHTAGGPELYAANVVAIADQQFAASCSQPHNCPGHPDFGKCNPTNIRDSCCADHDREYCANCCKASSWLPFVGSRECNRANRAAVGCFVRKLLGPGDGHTRSGAGDVGVGMQEFLDRYWGPQQALEDRLDCHFDISCDL